MLYSKIQNRRKQAGAELCQAHALVSVPPETELNVKVEYANI